MGVIYLITLRRADPMRVMTDAAGGILIPDMHLMQAEALIAEDAAPVMAPVTQGIGGRTLGRPVLGTVVADQ